MLLALVVATGARGQSDPRHQWLTIDTPHFEVHYHEGNHRLAAKIARIGEKVHARLAPLLDHVPDERCQIVLSDETDFANGSATPLLYNVIHAYAPPPDVRSTLNDFDDYAWELISHEYTHILHLDTVLGLPAMVNDIFGKLWIPNGGQPNWFIEGLAVFEESEVSGSGRVRSSQEEMAVRAEALEGRFPDIDKLSNATLDWPRGNGWYNIGGRFVDWIGNLYGAGALRDLSHDFGGRAIPLGMNLSAEGVLGQSYLELYKQFRTEEVGRAQALAAEVRAQGETQAEPLTRLGETVGSPRFSRDGRTLYYASLGPDRLPELRALPLPPCCDPGFRIDGQTRPGDARILASYGENRLAVADAGGRLVYSRAELFQEYAEIEDLYAVDASGAHGERLTRGLRAREPDVAPDGAVVFAQRQSGGRTSISLLEPGSIEPRILFTDPDGGPVGSPRFSPAGNLVAFVHHREGSWDVQLIGRDGSGLTDVTRDRAQGRDPSFSPDGRYLLFSSDRSGVYDLYALRLEDRQLLRITHMVSGAFEPEVSPDSSQLAFVTYSARGYDLARLPYHPASWTPEAGPSWQELTRPPVAPEGAPELYPVRPYEPLPTLRPHYWLPYASTDADGSTFGALTSGSDVALRHEYAATLWYGTASRMPGWDLTYTNHTLWPDLQLYTSRDLVVPAGLPYNSERQVTFGASLTFPFTAFERAFAFSVGYQVTHLAASENPQGFAPPDGNVASVQGTIAYSDALSFVRSVSAEQGQRASLTLRVADPGLGGDFSFVQLSFSASRYLGLPFTWNGRPLHHALALRLSGGLSHGDFSRRHLFTLGGFEQGDVIQTILNPQSAPVQILRGFRASSFEGVAYALGTLEYRFPLLDVETGLWTLPLYLRRIHAALFADAGDAWNPWQESSSSRFLVKGPFQLHAGAGAELRFETVLGYVLPTNVRVGCARGLAKRDDNACSVSATGAGCAILDCYAALGGVF